jgi:hypothetical protein
MSRAWGQRLRPEPGSGLMIGRWEPAGPADLTTGRRRLAAALNDGARPPCANEGAVERLLLAYEELASNGLRHGRHPVEVTVTGNNTSWLLEVSDAAADRPPGPAIGRDPARAASGCT